MFDFQKDIMMKNAKYLILVAGMILATACSKEPQMNIYQGRTDEVVFLSSTYSLRTTASDTDSYTLDVVRTSKDGAISVPITATFQNAGDADLFSIPTGVSFADGESAAQITISMNVAQMEKGKTISVLLKLDSETRLSASTSCTFSVTAEYTYKPYGTAIYVSSSMAQLFGQEIAYYQPVLVAEQDPTVFRLPDLYDNLGTQYSVGGYHLDFKWDGHSEELQFFEDADEDGCVTIASGFSHPSYGMMYLYVDTATEYTYYDAEEDVFVLNYATLVPYNGSLARLIDWGDDYFYMVEYAE